MIRRRERPSSFAKRRFAATLVFAGVAITGCTDWAGYDLDYIMGSTDLLSTMRSTISFEPQDLALSPPAGTVPVAGPGSSAPPHFTSAQLDSAAATLTNPLPATPEVLARGEAVYNVHCLVCHGAEGVGNGPVVGTGKFPMGPVLNGGTAATYSDGYLYGIIRVGRGLMPAYGERVAHEDRWAIVHYLRQIQGQTTGGAGAVAGAALGAQTPTAAAPTAASPDAGATPPAGQ